MLDPGLPVGEQQQPPDPVGSIGPLQRVGESLAEGSGSQMSAKT
ncbi:MAG TPA: hypothetical protein VJO36_10030 [Actinomycetota bacterium]|nr:hypothetical protein [Actinomycetota bacterium]